MKNRKTLMVIFSLIVLIVIVLIVFVKIKHKEDSGNMKGTVTAYAAPDSLPSRYISEDFAVTAEGQAIDLYDAGLNSWNNSVSFGYFDFSGGSIEVSITVNSSFDTYKLVPQSLGIEGRKKGNTVTFSISDPGNITLVLDEDYHGKILHLFAGAPEEDIPSADDPNVIYYGPGFYDLADKDPTLISSGQTLYIAGGALVRGNFKTADSSNVTFRGKGIIFDDAQNGSALSINNSSNVTVQDLIVCKGNYIAWNAVMGTSSYVNVIGYKAVSPHYASTDGFNICNSHDVTFDHVFIHSCDDSVAIKGLSAKPRTTENPADYKPVYNITYKNSQLWSDANNAIGIGAETEAQYFDNIHFSNIDILYNFDDRDNVDLLTDRSAINIFALDGTVFSNITFDDIRVEKAKRLINIEMHDSFWFDQLLGNWEWPGSMSGITYSNITSTSDGSNEIKVIGWDSSHQISNVSFNNININGEYVTSFDDKRFTINQFANDLHINYPEGSTVNLAQGPAGFGAIYNAADDFSITQGNNNWFYRERIAGVGTKDMSRNPDGSNSWRGTGSHDAIRSYNDSIVMQPDNNRIMLEWQAPQSGTVYVAGMVKKQEIGGGDGVEVSIWRNDFMVWPYGTAGSWKSIDYGDNAGYSHKVRLTVEKGDVISFRVDPKDNGDFDSTSWAPVISYQDSEQ